MLCVTHLPQVASLAENHFLVAKSQSEAHTKITIQAIDNSRDKRLSELARMLGDRNSESALKHAEDLLERSDLKGR